MTSPAAADNSTVTAIDSATPKKQGRSERAAAEKRASEHDELPDETTADETTAEADQEDAGEKSTAQNVDEEPPPSEDEKAAGDASEAPIAETRKQRKARQTIEDALAEKEAAEAKTAALVATQQAEAAEKERAAEQAATRKARLGRGARRWFRRAAVVTVVAAIGIGAYLAWPTVNERYVQPVESTAADVTNIQTDVSALQTLTSAENERLGELLVDLTTRTDELATETSDLQSTIDAVATGQGELDTRLRDLETQISDATRRIEGIDSVTTELGSALETTNNNASTQLTVLRATELLSRSRLLLYQANYGLAKADLSAARAALADLPDAPLLSAAIARLDLAVQNLPERPVAAAGDIDIAWAALLAGTTDSVRPADSFVTTPAETPASDEAAGVDQPEATVAGDETDDSAATDG